MTHTSKRRGDIPRIMAELEPKIREVGVHEVARRLGVSQPYVSQILAGKAVSLEVLQRFAGVVGHRVEVRLVRLYSRADD